MKLNDFFKNTNYDDSMFSDRAIQYVESAIYVQSTRGKETYYITKRIYISLIGIV
mgnify:CR=1 FL=1